MNTIAALIMGAAAAALVTALLGLAIIPWLRKLHFGQTILEIGPKWHEKKQGTPTMGGLMFIFGTIAAVAVTVITDKLLGGMVVAIAYALNCPLILLLTGIIYVIEGASDVLQIGYFKITHGKRIFKMAPIHHHFEMSGWSEKKIVAVFSIVNAVGGAAAIALMYFGGYAL